MVGSGEAENADYLMRINGLGNQQHGFRYIKHVQRHFCFCSKSFKGPCSQVNPAYLFVAEQFRTSNAKLAQSLALSQSQQPSHADIIIMFTQLMKKTGKQSR